MNVHVPLQGTSAADARGRFEERGALLARSKDDLADEFRALVRESEELLKSTTSLSSEALALARERFRGKLAAAKERLGDLSGAAAERGGQVAVAADDYVHASPWTAVGVAAAIGFVVGAILIRRPG